MQYLLFILLFLFSFQETRSQQGQNALLGKVYTKSASSTNTSTLRFTSATTGRSVSVLTFGGRDIETVLSFAYKINGNLLTIDYEKNSGHEEYTIDASSGQLISTHLQGYVDGKWGKVYWTEKVGAGTPGQDEASSYWWNQEKKSLNGKTNVGSQVWSTSNLSTPFFENGDSIPEAKNNEEWVRYLNENKPAWCFYDNSMENGVKYGLLYNWYAVTDPRGLAPVGWQIPSKEDWNILSKFFGGGSVYSRDANSMKARGEWAESAISEETKYSNTSGFAALPAGYRYADGKFGGKKFGTAWWTAEGSNFGMSYDRHSTTSYSDLSKQSSGLSVRLIEVNYFSLNKELKFVLAKDKSRYELTLLTNDGNGVAKLVMYDNNVLTYNNEGKWTIESSPGKQDQISVSLSERSGGGYETTYRTKNYVWDCVYDKLRNVDYLTNANGTWYNVTSGPTKIKVTDYVKVLGKPIKIGDLEVAQNDFPDLLSIGKAKVECGKLGKGWRLPTIDELKYLYKKSNKVLANYSTLHLSSTIDQSSGNYIMMNNNMNLYSYDANPVVFVRAVRGTYKAPTAQEEIRAVIGNPILLNKIEVAEFDVDHYLEYEYAIKACEKLGPGWRLPTKKELELIFKNRDKISGLEDGEYWTSSEFDGKDSKRMLPGFWILNFKDGSDLIGYPRTPRSIRVVRSR